MAARSGRSGSFDKTARGIEAEVRRVLDFVEERVVPRARRDGEKVLRLLAQELNRWANRLHDPSSRDSPPGVRKK